MEDKRNLNIASLSIHIGSLKRIAMLPKKLPKSLSTKSSIDFNLNDIRNNKIYFILVNLKDKFFTFSDIYFFLALNFTQIPK